MYSFPSTKRDWSKKSEILKEKDAQLAILDERIASAKLETTYELIGFRLGDAVNFYNHAISALNSWMENSDKTK